MNKIRLITLAVIILGCIGTTATAQESGLELLNIGPGTQALGLNDAVTAELLGASNLYSNPANLALEPKSSLNADYTLWIGDLTHAHAAINLKNDQRGLAFGFIGSQADDIPLRGNQAGPPEGTFAVSFLSLSGGYAYKLGPIALGGAFQYLREEYYTYNASGYAANFGAATQLWDNRIRLGASLLNVGQMNELRNESTTLPTTFRTGFSAEVITFTPPENDNLPITVFLKNDWIIPLQTENGTTQGTSSSDPFTNIALEFDIADTIQLRTGYKTGNTERPWSAGAGVAVGSITAQYALIPFKTGFGTVHSLGLSYQF